MDKIKKIFLKNNSESANKVNLIIILLSITMFLIIGVASIGFSLTNDNKSSNLKDFIKGVTITDNKGNSIEDGTLYVGEKYNIHLQFQEDGAQGLQFEPTEEKKLTYQIPKNFSVEPLENMSLTVNIGGEPKEIGHYSIDKDGLLTIELNDDGITAINSSTDVMLTFDIAVTTQPNPGGDNENVNFGDTESEFNFNISNDAKVEVEKTGMYTEDDGGADKKPTGGTLSYTVKATVEHGNVHDVVITDELTKPNNKGFDIKLQKESIKVTIKHGDNEEVIELPKEDYDITFNASDSENENQSFEIKLKEDSKYNPLKDGDVVIVTYNYRVNFVDYKEETDLYGDTITNDVTVKGTSEFTDPNTQEEKENQVEEHKKNETNVFRSPIGGGKVVKDQEYDANAKKLHYTVYAIVPKGNWHPFFLSDYLNVTFNGKTYSLQEFKENGRVKEIKISAMDLDEEKKNMTDSTNGRDLIKELNKIKNQAKELTGYKFGNFENYDPTSMDQYVYKFEDNVVHIIFGLKKDEQHGNDSWGRWGNWNYQKDRLIIIDYDLDLTEGNIDLKGDNEQGIIQKSVKEVLDAGITNDINLRYSGYYPGYTTFYTDADQLSKTGKFDKTTNTIDYTVSLNTADDEVKKYLEKVQDNWNQNGKEHGWEYKTSMQAEFYDVLPEGWEYVEDSFEIVTIDRGVETHWQFMKETNRSITTTEEIDGKKRTVISVPIVYFRSKDEYGNNRDMYSEVFKNPNITSFSFRYKLKATEAYLAEHASDEIKTPVHNKASIRDKDSTKWEAETDVDYFPTRLFKSATQEGTSNLIHFTLRINPNAVKLNKTNDFLIVNDNSVGMQIKMDTIKVTDLDGNDLTSKGNITLSELIQNNEWGIILNDDEEENKKFKLKVPDSKALIITYDALIESKGNDVQVSNNASIEGLVESDTNYQGVLQVDNIYGAGEGNTYELTFEKVDEDQTSKKLQGAKFNFCIVLKAESQLQETDEYTIGEKTYKCHKEEGWHFETNEKGQYKIEKEADWDLEPGNYYIIEETEAPEGYMLPEEPILFFYGMQNEIDRQENPKAILVLPNNNLIIKNEPIPYDIPVTGGIGHKIYYIVGFLLTILSLTFIFSRRIKLKN